uniref:Uncharacterized protein n=1 Tax=Mycena chlorophos TaxID=658473 RepID=A0ABQ0M0P3_MYCCL|nr:predicted protein [Mycena chlorophos]
MEFAPQASNSPLSPMGKSLILTGRSPDGPARKPESQGNYNTTRRDSEAQISDELHVLVAWMDKMHKEMEHKEKAPRKGKSMSPASMSRLSVLHNAEWIKQSNNSGVLTCNAELDYRWTAKPEGFEDAKFLKARFLGVLNFKDNGTQGKPLHKFKPVAFCAPLSIINFPPDTTKARAFYEDAWHVTHRHARSVQETDSSATEFKVRVHFNDVNGCRLMRNGLPNGDPSDPYEDFVISSETSEHFRALHGPAYKRNPGQGSELKIIDVILGIHGWLQGHSNLANAWSGFPAVFRGLSLVPDNDTGTPVWRLHLGPALNLYRV